MVLLQANRLDQVPKDAVVLTETDAIKYQWEIIHETGGELKL